MSCPTVCFLTFFACEVAVRCFAMGTGALAYLSKPLNALDLVVIILGILTDILLLTSDGEAADFTFLRLFRLIRIMRIAATLRRFLGNDPHVGPSEHHEPEPGRELLHQVSNLPPRCEWKRHGRTAFGSGGSVRRLSRDLTAPSPSPQTKRCAFRLPHD